MTGRWGGSFGSGTIWAAPQVGGVLSGLTQKTEKWYNHREDVEKKEEKTAPRRI